MPVAGKILFITQPYHAGVVEVAGRWVPLTLVTLAGSARAAGWEAIIVDAMTKGMDHDQVRATIAAIQPDVVAVSMFTATAPDGLLVLQAAKEVCPHCHTVAGGIHASFMVEEILGHGAVDFVVIGEGEQTLIELLQFLAGRHGSPQAIKGLAFRQHGTIHRTPPRPFLDTLDNRPMAWDLLDWQDYTYFMLPDSRLGSIATSRGCTYGCSFCSQQKFWQRTWRGRSPADVVREIEVLHHSYQVNVVLLTDDYPTADRHRWQALLDHLIAAALPVVLLMETRAADILRDRAILAKYRQAGIIHIYIGTESTNQTTLNDLGKELTTEQAREAIARCREHGIITETSMIIGFPDDTEQSIRETFRRLRDYDPDFAHFLTIAPWPYADITPRLAPHITATDYRRYNLVDPVVTPTALTSRKIDQLVIEGYRDFYRHKFPSILNSSDPFYKKYMLTALERIMKHSFIRRKLTGLLDSMPPELHAMLAGKS